MAYLPGKAELLDLSLKLGSLFFPFLGGLLNPALQQRDLLILGDQNGTAFGFLTFLGGYHFLQVL